MGGPCRRCGAGSTGLTRYVAVAVSLVAVLAWSAVPSAADEWLDFSYTGGLQTYTVPPGVTELRVDMAGGSGEGGYADVLYGGGGGRVQSVIRVTPGKP